MRTALVCSLRHAVTACPGTAGISGISAGIVLAGLLGAEAGQAQDGSNQTTVWATISPFLSPPPEFEGELGDYRSPLRFADGSLVQSPEDWAKRRAEILQEWHGLMGKWPPLITEPKVEVLETKRRDDFEQLQVRFRWTPNERTTAYLLIPDGERPRPAAVSKPASTRVQSKTPSAGSTSDHCTSTTIPL